MNFRNTSGHFAKSAGVAGGTRCRFCARKIKMGAVDEHRCARTKIAVSIDRAQLKRIDALALAAGMSRSRFLATSALTRSDLTADEQALIAIIRGMK